MQIWVTNVIGFALLFWELDRGGPVARHREARSATMPVADWRFSQDENDDAVIEVSRTSSGPAGWMPIFVDYLYLSLDQLHRLQPDRHHAADQPGQDADGHPGHGGPAHLLVVVSFAVGTLGS